MHLWRKTAEPRWLNAREEILQARSRGGLAIVEKPGSKRLQLEIACRSQRQAQTLLKDFGGRIKKVPRDWWQQLARKHGAKPLKIGKRLIVTRVGGTSVSRRSRHRGPSHLVIPAGAAFGTGEHPTTAMSLRLLDRLTRTWKSGWSLVDLGTGSGILALAAARFGAGRVLAIDLDPTAIATAKTNARANRIDIVKFRTGDVRQWKPARSPRDESVRLADKIDIVTANLFSELLIEILPKLKQREWLILSGILRAQEKELVRALRRNKIDTVEVRRRGKWIAILCRVAQSTRSH